MKKELAPLEKNSNELADLILAWYEQNVREKYYMRDIYNQLARSATSIGANIAEAQFSQSDADYKSKMHIALKEANETKYWVERMIATKAIKEELRSKLNSNLDNIIRILVSICNK